MKLGIMIAMIIWFVQPNAFAHKLEATGFMFTATSEGPANDDLPGMKTITNTIKNETGQQQPVLWIISGSRYVGGTVNAGTTEKATFQTRNPTVEVAGTLNIGSGQNVESFQAIGHMPVYVPPAARLRPGARLVAEYSVIAGSTESSLIKFTSEFSPTDEDSAEFKYTVTTSSPSPVSFEWDFLSGTVSSSNPFSYSFDGSIFVAEEILADASFILGGANTTIMAPFLGAAVVPEPSIFVLFLTGFLVILTQQAVKKLASHSLVG